MRGVWKLTWVEIKLFLREPMAAFFTLAFPLVLLFVFSSIFGNEPFEGSEFGFVDVIVPAYTALIIATSGLLSLPITMAAYREFGVLRRLRVTPLRPQTVLTAELILLFVMTTLGMTLLIIVGKLVYDLRFFGNTLSVLAAFALSCLSFFSIGFVLAGLVSTARTAQVVGMVLFFPMMFLSGVAYPPEKFPETMYQISQVLPLTHVVSLLQGLWLGEGWSDHVTEVGILSALLVAGVIVSAKTFRWE